MRSKGLEVIEQTLSNCEAIDAGRLATARALWRSAHNDNVYRQVHELCRRTQPDLAHIHNFWFMLSPSPHAACHAAGVPTVQTLHNFRLLCLNGVLFRGSKPCRDCVGHRPWRGIFRRCYRRSITQSALLARMIGANRRRDTWRKDVDAFVAPSEACRLQFADSGLPFNRIFTKPNSVEDPGIAPTPGDGAVFAGRLAPEKGLHGLLRAWKSLPDIPLRIIGDGPLRAELERETRNSGLRSVDLAGRKPPEECLHAIKQASFLVMPSEWPETFGLVIVEAFACGRPVIASNLGAMAELIEHGRTGLLFRPGDAEDLAAQARWMVDHPDQCMAMGRAAREEYERKYTPERNYRMLMTIYEQTLHEFRSRRGHAPGNRGEADAGVRGCPTGG
jgi:glycosyltransferase involved in cell wall biosynthesis